MKRLVTPLVRSVLAAAAVVALLPLAAPVAAQTPAEQATAQPTPQAVEPAAVAGGRPDKGIQRIRTEDAGTRIDELRVGGETQSITVQPKTGAKVPAYEVKPSDTSRGSAPSSSSGDTNGSRVWNVMKF